MGKSAPGQSCHGAKNRDALIVGCRRHFCKRILRIDNSRGACTFKQLCPATREIVIVMASPMETAKAPRPVVFQPGRGPKLCGTRFTRFRGIVGPSVRRPIVERPG
jgi:hypothetical protein